MLGATKSELKAILGEQWPYFLAYFDQQIRKYGLNVSMILNKSRFVLVSNIEISQVFTSSELNHKVLGTFLMFCVLLGIKERKSGIPIKELARNRKLHQNTVKTHIIQLQEKGYVSLDLKTNTVIPTDQLFCEINLQETYKQISALLDGKSNLFRGH